MTKEDWVAFDMPAAKVVLTPEGEALLIGGDIYRVTGPGGNAADLFAKALRRSGQWASAEAGGKSHSSQINAAYQSKMAS